MKNEYIEEANFRINDEVEFMVSGIKYEGIINYISPNGLLRINSLIGEYRRKPDKLIKIIR